MVNFYNTIYIYIQPYNQIFDTLIYIYIQGKLSITPILYINIYNLLYIDIYKENNFN